jgi:hypothetical protein
MTHDYKRHGTTTLFAALDILEGNVIGRCMQLIGSACRVAGRLRPDQGLRRGKKPAKARMLSIDARNLPLLFLRRAASVARSRSPSWIGFRATCISFQG